MSRAPNSQWRHQAIVDPTDYSNEEEDEVSSSSPSPSIPIVTSRRDMLLSTVSTVSMFASCRPETVQAMGGVGGGTSSGEYGGILQRFSGIYVVNTKDGDDAAFSVRSTTTTSTTTEAIDSSPVSTSSSEYALLKVLPVKNPVFRTLEQNIEALSVLRYPDGTPPVYPSSSLSSSSSSVDVSNGADGKLSDGISINNSNAAGKTWLKAERSVATAISLIDNKRPQLEPIFNPDDSTELAIYKAERGEVLIGDLRQGLEQLKVAIGRRNTTCIFAQQRKALLNLGFLGELLVKEYPYRVPSRGKYSLLPRLLGRAKVTFRFKRPSNGKILGDVTLVADGYTAPITAGNFVDLCLRNFYTGLPVRATSKRVGSYQDPVLIPDVMVLGSFNEGFYDPLTGKLRRIPLEITRLEGTPKLSYSSRRLPGDWGESSSFEDGEGTFQQAATTSKALLTFETPGLVALNHPTSDPNGGSSEFFAMQFSSSSESRSIRRSLMDGQYAPFGFIIEGADIFNSLRPDDVIESTIVDDFGALNLVKIRESSFKEMT